MNIYDHYHLSPYIFVERYEYCLARSTKIVSSLNKMKELIFIYIGHFLIREIDPGILGDWTESTAAGRNITGGIRRRKKFPCKCFVIDILRRRRSRHLSPAPASARAPRRAISRHFSRCVFFERVFTPEEQREYFARRRTAYTQCKFPNQQFKAVSTRLIKGFGISSTARNLDLFSSRR